MTDAPPGTPPGPRDPAEGWVDLPDGRRFWGRAGAAGLLAVAPGGSVLLQHRVGWSHFGGTWGLPGGARHEGEPAFAGALRETQEETGIDVAALSPRFAVRLDLEVWSYTTVVAAVPAELPVSVADRESTALEWVAAELVAARELHPGFAAAWPRLQRELALPDPVLVVDAANVVGSRPDGWWKDRAGAATRLLASLAVLRAAGVPEGRGAEEPASGEQAAGESGRRGPGAQDSIAQDSIAQDAVAQDSVAQDPLPVVRRWPRIVVVLEGEARAAADAAGLDVVRAAGSGDDEIVAQVERAAGSRTTVVTADRGLAERVRALGADVVGPSRLRSLLEP